MPGRTAAYLGLIFKRPTKKGPQVADPIYE
ncbi:hypothetical protein NIT7645_00823 [Phaeobacter italicus]|nr:hypothetical protein NIT7645_00823 [Phaeobacter italicus]SFG05147.1 hypothetical protein SAMN04488019_101158 [Phaeobacter italicus]